RARIETLEAAARTTAAAPGVAPPPLPRQEPPRPAPEAETVSTTTEAAPPIAPEPIPQVGPAMTPPPPPPPLSETQPGFEERIGTRWVVWVGGLTLALGGFF